MTNFSDIGIVFGNSEKFKNNTIIKKSIVKEEIIKQLKKQEVENNTYIFNESLFYYLLGGSWIPTLR